MSSLCPCSFRFVAQIYEQLHLWSDAVESYVEIGARDQADALLQVCALIGCILFLSIQKPNSNHTNTVAKKIFCKYCSNFPPLKHHDIILC